MRGRALLLVVGAGSLLAVVPAPTASAAQRWTGWTSPGRNSSVLLTDDYAVLRVRVQWRAKCRRPRYVYRGDTTFQPVENGRKRPWKDSVGEGGFVRYFWDGGRYRERFGRMVGVIRIQLRGAFAHDPGNAHATFAGGRVTGSVRVRRRGRTIDRCRIKSRFESHR